MDQGLLQRIAERARGPARIDAEVGGPDRVHPALSAQTLEGVEARLGFALPAAVRALYGEIGNGGFGPGYGFLGLIGGATEETGRDAVGLYEELRRPDEGDSHWHWPEGLLPIGHLGCAMFGCVECGGEDAPVVWFEPNPHVEGEPWGKSFLPLAPSLEDWLKAWIGGRDGELFEAARVAVHGE